MVGTNTVLQDNPTLTVRDWTGKNPTRIVLDKNESFDKTFSVFNDEAETLTLKATTAKAICDQLFKAEINSVIIEGGARTLQLFIDENLWDEARVFKGKTTFKSGVKAPKFNGQCIETSHILEDMFSIYKNENN